MAIPLERSVAFLENQTNQISVEENEEITITEERELQRSLDHLRMLTAEKGEIIKLTNLAGKTIGTSHELELPSGLDAIYSGVNLFDITTIRDVDFYLIFVTSQGSFEFRRYKEVVRNTGVYYSFSKKDHDDKYLMDVVPQPMSRMKKGIFEVVLDVAKSATDKALAVGQKADNDW